jgi:DNA-binding MarR family transcriptional regulator
MSDNRRVRSRADVATDAPARYAEQLVSPLGRKVDVETIPEGARAGTGHGDGPPAADPLTQTGAPWLNEAEMQTWLRVLRLVMLLPGSLDRQLRRDAGLTHVSYMILATLSDAPGSAMRMTELAQETATSQSRLSHAVSALEQRGWVARRPCPQDRRGQIAALTDSGRRVLEQTAPGHVAQVRATVLDPLTPSEVHQLSALLAKIVAPLEADDTRAYGAVPPLAP